MREEWTDLVMRLRVRRVGVSRVDRVEDVSTLGELRAKISVLVPNLGSSNPFHVSLDKKVVGIRRETDMLRWKAVHLQKIATTSLTPLFHLVCILSDELDWR